MSRSDKTERNRTMARRSIVVSWVRYLHKTVERKIMS